MNKKKWLISAAAAVVVLAVILTVTAVVKANNTVKAGGVYPYSATVGKDSVKLKITGRDEWEAVPFDSDLVDVRQNSAREFTITVGESFSGALSFVNKSQTDGTHYIGITVSRLPGEKPRVLPVAMESRASEKEYCGKTDMPLKFIPGHIGEAEVLFPGKPGGLWDVDAPKEFPVSGPINDQQGMHFYLSAREKGEYKVVFSDLLEGLTSTVTFAVDEHFNISVLSADAGTCAKAEPETFKSEPKDEPEETTDETTTAENS